MTRRFVTHGATPPGHLADPARVRRERSANAPGGRWRSKWKPWHHTLVARPTAGLLGRSTRNVARAARLPGRRHRIGRPAQGSKFTALRHREQIARRRRSGPQNPRIFLYLAGRPSKAAPSMDLRIASIPRFLYSHYFFGGVRQGVGMLLPVLVLGGLFGEYGFGLVATFAAQCLAIIDQPGGPQRHRTNEMLGGAPLATTTVTITGAASTYPVLLRLAVIGQCFLFSMFSVFGKRGGLIGFAGLLIMTLTMHSPLAPSQVLAHSAATLGGALFYLAFSLGFSRIFWLDRKSTRLNSSHVKISYAVFCLKK